MNTQRYLANGLICFISLIIIENVQSISQYLKREHSLTRPFQGKCFESLWWHSTPLFLLIFNVIIYWSIDLNVNINCLLLRCRSQFAILGFSGTHRSHQQLHKTDARSSIKKWSHLEFKCKYLNSFYFEMRLTIPLSHSASAEYWKAAKKC